VRLGWPSTNCVDASLNSLAPGREISVPLREILDAVRLQPAPGRSTSFFLTLPRPFCCRKAVACGTPIGQAPRARHRFPRCPRGRRSKFSSAVEPGATSTGPVLGDGPESGLVAPPATYRTWAPRERRRRPRLRATGEPTRRRPPFAAQERPPVARSWPDAQAATRFPRPCACRRTYTPRNVTGVGMQIIRRATTFRPATHGRQRVTQQGRQSNKVSDEQWRNRSRTRPFAFFFVGHSDAWTRVTVVLRSRFTS